MHTAIRSRTAQFSLDVLFVHVGRKAPVDLFGYLPERQFAQSDQVSATEEILQGLFDFFLAVNVAALHPVLKRFGRQVDHHGFLRKLKHPVRHRFAHRDSSDRAHGGSDAFDVLDVHGGEHVDLRVEKLEDVLITLAVPASGDIGVCQLIDQRHQRLSREDGVDVHLLENRSLVIHLSARNRLKLARQLGDSLSSVCFDHADHHILAALARRIASLSML